MKNATMISRMKKLVMKTAWSMYKANGCTTKIEFGACLKAAWKIEREGNYWEKGAMKRYYFNDLSAAIGLEMDFYKSGNVCCASLNGEKISNAQCYRILSALDMGKFFYDVTTGCFCSKNLPDEYAPQILSHYCA